MYDAVVAGLGGMGSAALAHLSLRGSRVLGIDQFDALHERGASSGRTRIIRQAYFEDPAYVPMLVRAYELWRDLERTTGEDIFRLVGLLLAGTPDSEVISGSLLAAQKHGLPVESLNAAELRARYPMLRVYDDEAGVFEREAGAVFPERAIRAHLDLAREHGAQTRFNTEMRAWQSDGQGVSVELGDGTSVRTRSLVLTLGPWFSQALHEAGVKLEVQRNVQVWFTPRTAAYDAAAFPAFLIERRSLPAPLYGFPDFGNGVKAAFHGLGALTDPEALERGIDPQKDVQPLAQALEEWMPGASGSFREGKACMYALTPDRHFVIDRHPRDPRVVLCGGFSGHGFKFASVVGEIAAQLALEGGTPHAIDFLGLRRFQL
ncbi:MAG TPA: N-methyl-L-tryptophan oxidase [Candidatus Baltobacteraceae bacterium]|nr:N-methyl-L-tryptophan oxidase [Candidatus Baltobacteraceae bacterium]